MDQVFQEMDDDFNTPKAMAKLFELVSKINSWKDGHTSIGEIKEETLERLKSVFRAVIFDVLGLKEDQGNAENNKDMDGVMQLIIDLRKTARENKDWASSDKIRDSLNALNIKLMDGKEGTSWTKE